MPSIDTAVAHLAGRQHGLVTTTQLHSLGISRKVIARRVASGQWLKFAAVLRIAGTPVTWESQVLAHVLAAGDGAVASHRSAAVLWNLDGCRRGIPEITVPRGLRYRTSDARVHESTDLDRIHVVSRDGVPTTPVARTLLDLGAVLPEQAVELIIDDARRRGLTDWSGLVDILVRHARRGRNGVGSLRAILDSHEAEIAVTDSGFERLVMTLLLEAALPQPVLQHEVEVAGRLFRLDLAYPQVNLGIELDGSVHLKRDVWEADHARQNALILAGWTILRFTWRDYRDFPGRIVKEVRAALRASSAEIATHAAQNGPSTSRFRMG